MPEARNRRKPARQRTRREILERLKLDGPQDARRLADRLGITAMAVRQHLYALQDEKLVCHEQTPRRRGRPAKLWKLTRAADRHFPDRHADLACDLVAALGEAFGGKGMDKLLAARARRQIDDYRSRMPRRASLRRRLEALAAIRSDEGYMAEVLGGEEGSFLLVENHCPICLAAAACTGLCGAELQVFQTVLGEDVQVERTEHILAGARRCAYRVRRRTRRRPR